MRNKIDVCKAFLIRKAKSKKGETLVETLAAILIITLATIILIGSTMGASKINKKVKEADNKFYEQVDKAELKRAENKYAVGQIYIKNDTYSVNITENIDLYGEDKGLTSFD